MKDLRYRTMPEIASQSIKRAILEGKIKPGEQLRQDALASRFGFSRSPIREALLCLEAAGLVTFEPHRGVTIPVLNVSELQEIFDLWILIEGKAAASGACNLTAADIENLKGLYKEMNDPDRDPADWIDLNKRFHEIIYHASAKRSFCRAISNLADRVDPYIRISIQDWLVRKSSQREHKAILSACRERDGKRVQAATEAHYRRVFRNLTEKLQKAAYYESLNSKQRDLPGKGEGNHGRKNEQLRGRSSLRQRG